MKNNWLTQFSKLTLVSIVSMTLVTTMGKGVSMVRAKSASVSEVNNHVLDNSSGKTTTASPLNSALSAPDPCSGPTIYLTGQTTSRYKNDYIADRTTFDRTGWYSDAVGNGADTAFTVGNHDPAPLDVCVLGGVVNGHLPLSYTWQDSHDFGGSGDRTYTGRIAYIDGARVHNVEDGWHPRELPELSNVGIMQMRNTYMTGIRDDAIENDNFMPGFIEDSLFDGVFTFLSEQNENGTGVVTLGPNEDPYIRITRVYARLYPTNSDGYDLYSARWFKWKPEGATNHNLIITDSVFAAGPVVGRWSVLEFPPGTTFQGTNYILWLGASGEYEATVPPGVILLEGQPALDKWNEVRNNWLIAHGYDPRPANDLNPMDDPVVAP